MNRSKIAHYNLYGIPMRIVQLIILVFLLSSCGGIQMLSGGKKEKLYTDAFTAKIETIKTNYKAGKKEEALGELLKMDEKLLMPTERALRRNLIGVIYFSKADFEKAIFNFDQALLTSRLDEGLTAQIYLNLASCYYKLDLIEKAYSTMSAATFNTLSANELSKFHKLKYRLAKELGKDRDVIISLIHYLGNKTKISDFKSDPLYEMLMSRFVKLETKEKFKIFEEFEERETLIVGYLAYLEAEKLYYSGEKGEAEDLLGWVEKGFNKYPEIDSLVKNFGFRMENTAKIDTNAIGILLPLSGKRANFGQRALKGFDAAMLQLKEKGESTPFNIHIKDSLGSGVVGAQAVRELVEKNFVSVIVGGLFPNEAEKEYLEAKRHGVFFISLSQIYLPKEQKDHLLLEVPGSIESQINQLFSPEMLEKFGRKAAIIYPKTQRGASIVDEFWRKSILNEVEVTDVLGFEKKGGDYRLPVKKLLGLQYPRERQEEYDILEEIYALEDNRSMRRIQTLKPQVDFDWVFIPSFPLEAIQIIPSFTYYDAFNVTIFGGPSWRSKRLKQESYKFKNIHLVGDDVKDLGEYFTKWFITKYERPPGLIEMRAFDSFQIINGLIKDRTFSTREELDLHIRGLSELDGLTGSFKLGEGVWLKKMVSLHLRNGKLNKDFVIGTQVETLEAPSSKEESP